MLVRPKRPLIIAALAVVVSLMAAPASAHAVPIDITPSCPPSTPSAGFNDIGTFGDQTQLAINCLVTFEIATGTTPTTYSPNNGVVRWQMALFLVRQAVAHGLVAPAPVTQGFADLGGLPQATQDAINQVTQMGVANGTTSTTFAPNDVVTRWQMALFLYRLAGLAGVTVVDNPTDNSFTDIGAFNSDIQTAINFLADGHVVIGVSEGVFAGNDNVARWQMALFITRVLAADGVGPA